MGLIPWRTSQGSCLSIGLISWRTSQGSTSHGVHLKENISRLLNYYNIMFSYRIRKIVRNIPINVLDHERKK